MQHNVEQHLNGLVPPPPSGSRSGLNSPVLDKGASSPPTPMATDALRESTSPVVLSMAEAQERPSTGARPNRPEKRPEKAPKGFKRPEKAPKDPKGPNRP